MKKKSIIIVSILILILGIYFFCFYPFITPDGTRYYYYLEIFNGHNPISSWDVTRGPVMPLILYLMTLLFGYTYKGFLIGSLIFYLLFLLVSYLIIRKLLINKDKKVKIITNILFVILLMFNPILFGYQHTVLTEIVIPLFATLACIMSIKWIDLEFISNKRTFILYGLAMSILGVLTWFLKQPYFLVVWFPYFLGSLLSIIKHRNKINILSRIIFIIVTILFLIIGIKGWTKFLESNGVDYTSGNTTSNLMTNQTMAGLMLHYRPLDEGKSCDIKYIKQDKYLTKKDKKQIVSMYQKDKKKYCKKIKIYNIIKDKKVIEQVVFYHNGTPTTISSLKFILGQTIDHPLLVTDSYVSSYLTVIDLYDYTHEHWTNYKPIKKFDFYFHENQQIGLRIYKKRPAYVWYNMTPKEKNQSNYANPKMRTFENNNNRDFYNNYYWYFALYQSIFSNLLLIAPFMFIYGFIKSVKKKTKNKLKYEIITILNGAATVNVILHAFFGSMIDRYAIVSYILTIIGFICLVIPNNNSYLVLEKIKKKINKNKKTYTKREK